MNPNESLYTSVFYALPTPATIVDSHGFILDANPGFMSYHSANRSEVDSLQVIGKNLADFVDPARRQAFSDFVERVFATGSGRFRQLSTGAQVGGQSAADGQQEYVVLDGSVIRDDEGGILGALVVQSAVNDPMWQEERRQVMARLRDAIWTMTHSVEMDKVMIALHEGLTALSLPFLAYGVNLVSEDEGGMRITCYTDRGKGDGRWQTMASPEAIQIVGSFWREKKIVYRRDLDNDDPFHEAVMLRTTIGSHVRSVVDVPFAFGTLAVDSTEPNAFDEVDLDILRELAGALEEGMRRKDDLKRLEVAIQEANEMALRAEAANLAKTNFLANMSHEIRTPMNGVIGMAALLGESDLTPEQAKYAQVIRQSGEHLLGVIGDILDFAKLEADRITLERIAFDLERVLESIAAQLGGAAEAKGLQLSYSCAKELRRPLMGDPARLRQAIYNLVGNAIKFTESGTVQIEAVVAAQGRSRSEQSAEQTVVQISVHDTGIGIHEAKAGELFQPFQQLESSTSRRFGGTGLGLAISKRLVELMGGEIGVHNHDGPGAEFWLIVPLDTLPFDAVAHDLVAPEKADVQSMQATASQEEIAQVQGAEATNHAGRRRILLVEDNKINQQVGASMLKKLGFEVQVAANGVAAIEALRVQEYDLVLMDIMMPEMDGYAATKAIRDPNTVVRNPSVPIIAMTASTLPEDREACLRCGMNDFISKPIRFADLSALITHWLDAP